MKIICDNMEEYDQLMEASKFLHDFTYETGRWKRVTECLDFEKYPTINFLAHLHLTVDDFPDKFEIVLIENND